VKGVKLGSLAEPGFWHPSDLRGSRVRPCLGFARRRRGRLAKHGAPALRRALVEAAQHTTTGYGSILSKMRRAAGRSAGDGGASTFVELGSVTTVAE
jgi:hypothetical protein